MFEAAYVLIFALFLFFVISHLRPLNVKEINQLGNKRRLKGIDNYYSYTKNETRASKEFKSRMDKDGELYDINESLFGFPAKAAALLKYKKHEWIIIGFEKERSVFQIWCNKGEDKTKVEFKLTLQQILVIAMRNNVTTVLAFHNHPNPNPSRYRTNRASETDLDTADRLSSMLTNNDINLLEFVCERGRTFEYYRSISKRFLPLTNYVNEISKMNGQSRWGNFELHMERIF